jgi:hypothetical protein
VSAAPFPNFPNVAAAIPRDDETSWPARQPLPPLRQEVPGLPESLLPTPLRPWIVDEAERLGSCLEFIAVPAIIGAGSLLGRNLTIHPKARDRWTVVPNLWGCVIGRPSTMKSPSAAAAHSPLRRLAGDALEEFRAARAVSKARVDILLAQRAALLKKAAKSAVSEEFEGQICDLDLKIAAAELAARRRRLIVNDATVEALVEILAQNPRGVLVLRDELAGFLRMLERDGHEADRPFYIEAYEGGVMGDFESDRISRGNIRSVGPCVSIFGAIQPGRIDRYVRGAVAGRAEADGFLQRFQLTVWPDAPGEGRGVDREPSKQAFAEVFRVFRVLDLGTSRTFASVIEDGSLPYLHFDAEAQGIFNTWFEEHHRAVRAPELEKTPAFEEHLVKGRKMVPALALIFHALDVAAGIAQAGPVSATALDLAVNWGDFLRTHAEKLYAVELRENVAAAHALASKLEEQAVLDGMTVNDIAERDWSGLAEPSLVHAALDVLEPLGWIQRKSQPTSGRTRTVVRIHPDFRRVP